MPARATPPRWQWKARSLPYICTSTEGKGWHKAPPCASERSSDRGSMKIVVLDGYCMNPGDLSWDALRQFGELEVYDRTPAAEAALRAHGATAVLLNKTPLTADTLARLPELKYIGVLATGYDVVDMGAARGQGITVTNVPT